MAGLEGVCRPILFIAEDVGVDPAHSVEKHGAHIGIAAVYQTGRPVLRNRGVFDLGGTGRDPRVEIRAVAVAEIGSRRGAGKKNNNRQGK